MVSSNTRRGGIDRRLLWCFVVSLLLNAFLWVACPRLAFHRDDTRQKVVVSSIHFERRKPPRPHPRLARRPRPRPKPVALRTPAPRPPATPKPEVRKKIVAPALAKPHRRLAPPLVQRKPSRNFDGTPSMSFTTHQSAALDLPTNWSKQDLANGAAADTTLWIDFKKAKGAIVPRVFLLHLNTSYLSGPTLDDAVHDIVGNLREEGAKMYVSKARRVCGGRVVGWFLSYEKPRDDPPLQFIDTIFISGDTVYRATYSRAAGQPEDPKTRAALSTLCPSR